MISYLDNLLGHLFMSRVEGLRPPPSQSLTEEQIDFRPPDDDWRTHVSGLGTKQALSVFLVELPESRKLRSNVRTRDVQNRIVNESPAPTADRFGTTTLVEKVSVKWLTN